MAWRQRLAVVMLALFLAAAWLPVQAQSHTQLQRLRAPTAEASTDEVKARLLVSVATVQPGQTITLGLNQRIKEHWHTYWANPGDSGLATTIAWTAPAGTAAGPIQWPTPQRFDIGPITNHGYEGEVTLLTTLTLPKDLAVGSTARLLADVRWLVCADVCIPQDVQLAVSLPVVSAPAAPSADALALEAARKALPASFAGTGTWARDGQMLTLKLADAGALPAHDRAHFYAGVFGQVVHAADQTLSRHAGTWQLQMPASDMPPSAGDAAVGVLKLIKAGQPDQHLAIGGGTPALVPTVKAPSATGSPAATASPQSGTPFLWSELALGVGLALLGGMVLNLMPCVFPVLSIKALSLVKSAGGSRREMRGHGLAYTAGVLVCFVGLAALLLLLKGAGSAVGWGFQFQSPVFVTLVALLMLAVGLQLSGVWTLGSSVAGIGSGLAAREGLVGSFFTGVLAAVVATPCTAPFMGAAIGYALSQPAAVTLAVFAALGLGLALPYLILTAWPALQRSLPRPGPWMERLKQALAFPMYASAAWLAWVLTQQAGPEGLAVLLGAAVLLAFAAWLQGVAAAKPGASISSAVAGALALLAVAGSAWAVRGSAASAELAASTATLSAPNAASTASPSTASDAAPAKISGWEPYSPERLQALRSQGAPVFVNLTASWCITCLVNERVALNLNRVQAAFEAAGVVRMKGDWTRGDPRITALLSEQGRSGVPLYLMYPAGGGQPVLLPQLLTPDMVIEAIEAARPDRAMGPAPARLPQS